MSKILFSSSQGKAPGAVMYCNSRANHEYTGTHRIPGSAINAIKLISRCPYRLLKEQAGNAMVTVNYPGQQFK